MKARILGCCGLSRRKGIDSSISPGSRLSRRNGERGREGSMANADFGSRSLWWCSEIDARGECSGWGVLRRSAGERFVEERFVSFITKVRMECRREMIRRARSDRFLTMNSLFGPSAVGRQFPQRRSSKLLSKLECPAMLGSRGCCVPLAPPSALPNPTWESRSNG